jgi:hypothetical protein
MKAFPVVVLVLLGFASFFVTFLVAPLAVLMIFYVVYATLTSRPERAAAPAPETDPQPRWGATPEIEGEPVAVPARRARITVASHSERAAVLRGAATAAAVEHGDAGAPAGSATATTAAPAAATATTAPPATATPAPPAPAPHAGAHGAAPTRREP